MGLDEERPGLGDEAEDAADDEEHPPEDAFAPSEGGEHGEGDGAGVS